MDKEDLLLLLNTSKKSQEIGAQAAALSLVRSVVESLVEQLPTTAPPTPTAPTTESQWGVGTNVCRSCGQRKEMLQDESTCQDCMTAVTPASSQSDQVDTKNGPVEQDSECVHWTTDLEIQMTPRNEPGIPISEYRWLLVECKKCHASWWFVKTPAPDVGWPWLTSVKQDSKESVESSAEESVKSVLKELIEGFKGLRNFEGKTDKDKGYQEGILTAETCIEAKLQRRT